MSDEQVEQLGPIAAATMREFAYLVDELKAENERLRAVARDVNAENRRLGDENDRLRAVVEAAKAYRAAYHASTPYPFTKDDLEREAAADAARMELFRLLGISGNMDGWQRATAKEVAAWQAVNSHSREDRQAGAAPEDDDEPSGMVPTPDRVHRGGDVHASGSAEVADGAPENDQCLYCRARAWACGRYRGSDYGSRCCIGCTHEAGTASENGQTWDDYMAGEGHDLFTAEADPSVWLDICPAVLFPSGAPCLERNGHDGPHVYREDDRA